jgi:hypothetical protein
MLPLLKNCGGLVKKALGEHTGIRFRFDRHLVGYVLCLDADVAYESPCAAQHAHLPRRARMAQS